MYLWELYPAINQVFQGNYVIKHYFTSVVAEICWLSLLWLCRHHKAPWATSVIFLNHIAHCPSKHTYSRTNRSQVRLPESVDLHNTLNHSYLIWKKNMLLQIRSYLHYNISSTRGSKNFQDNVKKWLPSLKPSAKSCLYPKLKCLDVSWRM